MSFPLSNQHIENYERSITGSDDTSQDYVCRNCEKHFVSTCGLRSHMKNAHGETNLRWKRSCSLCGKNVIFLDNHMRKFHRNQWNPICEICSKTITSNIKEHRRFCIQCPYCSYQNKIKSRLITHINKCSKAFQLWKIKADWDCKYKWEHSCRNKQHDIVPT